MNVRLHWLCALAACLSACDNNPHVPPWKKTGANGSPWVVSYRVFPEDPRSLDPQFAYDELSHVVVASVYDTFLTYEPLKENYELIPMMAAEMPQFEPKPDGTVDVICKIKPGIFFHDDPCFPQGKGREVTSRDFVYSFQRMADPKVECPIAATFQDYLVGFTTVYDAADKSGTFDYDAPFAPVEAVDRYTFRIHMTKPYPQIKYWLAFWFTAPVAREAVEYYNGKVIDGVRRPLFRFHPVGDSAFKLAEWKRGQIIRFIRNDNYHTLRFPTSGWPSDLDHDLKPLAGAQLPIVDEVQLILMRESIPAWILFRQGWTDASGVGKDVFNSVITANHTLTEEYKRRNVTLIKDVEPDVWYLMFNMKDPVLGSNAKLRKALALAYNADKLNDIFGNGIYNITGQFLPPGMFGYDPNFKNPWRDKTNLEEARQLLTEAGYPDGIDPKTGKPLELVFDTQAGSGAERQMAEFDRSQFEQLGIRVRIQENLFSQMMEKEMKATYQMVTSGWEADYPDPENFLSLLYGPNAAPVGHNLSVYRNPEFDKLYEQMATMEDSPERAALIQKLNHIALVEDCVVAPIFNQVAFALRQPWTPYFVKNPIVSKFGGMRYTVIDAELRAKKQAEWNRKNYWPLTIALTLIIAVVAYGIRRRARDNV